MGYVCERHQEFVQTNQVCRWCNNVPSCLVPAQTNEVEAPYGGAMMIPILKKMELPKLEATDKNPILPKVEALSKKNPYLQDLPYEMTPVETYAKELGALEKSCYPPSRYPYCRCGEVMFDRVIFVKANRPIEAFTKYVHHTPQMCTAIIRLTDEELIEKEIS